MGGSSTSTQQVTVPADVLARYNAVNTRAEETAGRPFTPYSTDPNAFVAGLNPTQQAGIYNTNVAATMAQPFYGQATNQLMGAQAAAVPFYGSAAQLNMQGARAVNPGQLGAQQIGQYMSPYLGTVLQGTAALQNQMNQQAMSGQLGNAIRQGAFGGDRAGIAAANLAQQQQLASNKTFADILNQGYGQALGTAQQQQQLGLSAEQANRQALQQAAQQQAALGQGLYGIGAGTSQQLAALGQGAQAAGLAGAQAQLAAGQAGQQTEQAGKTALYNQFLQQQSYPFQVAQFLANIAMGTGSLSGSTTTTNQPGGLFSDRRLKENAQVIGKTFDGQPIYKFNYKGDDTTQIGLMAQNVEKHHPEAVGLAGGYKTVDYDKATHDAAKRGHFASGGYASAGGGVMPQHAGQGFADGGYAGYDPAIMQQILSSYQQMYAPMGGLGAAEGTITGMGRNIPAQAMAPHSLMVAGDLPKQVSGVEQVKDAVDTASELRDLSGDVEDFFKKKSKTKANGGLAGYAIGGAMPYEKQITGPQLDIPDEDSESKSRELQKAAQLGKPRSAMDDVKDIASTAATIASLFSDKRLKENIKPVGKTFDGQTVYSYNYKGDKTTHMGLIAQEVERHHPHAVGHAGKYKTVNYDKATGLAAKRGHFADGGDTEEDETTDPMYLDMEEMKDIKPELTDRLMQKLRSQNEAPRVETETQDQDERPQIGAPAPVDAALDVADKATSEDLPVFDETPSGKGLMGKIAKVEGTGKNPMSSAVGKYQIVNDTFVNYFRKLHPEEARGMSRRDILALRNSPQASSLYEEMGAAITADNKKTLRESGLPVSDKNVYALHFLGPKYGVKVLMADADAPVDSIVPSKFIKSNPSVLKDKTAGEVRNWIGNKMLSTGGVAPQGYQRGGYATKGGEGLLPDDVRDLADAEDAGITEAETPKKGLVVSSLPAAPAQTERAPRIPDTTPSQTAPTQTGDYINQMPYMMTPQGIAAATQNMPDYYGAGPDEKGSFIQNLIHGKGHKQTDALLSLLSGIGTAAAAPTRNPLTAILAGLGAGAGTYQKMRDYELQRAKTAQELAQRNRTLGLTGTEVGLLAGQFPYGVGQTLANTGLIGAQTQRTMALITPEVQEAFARAGLLKNQSLQALAATNDIRTIPDGQGGASILLTSKVDGTTRVVPMPAMGGGTETGAPAPQTGAPAPQTGAPKTPVQPTQKPAAGWRPITTVEKTDIPASYYMLDPAVLESQRTHDTQTLTNQEASATAAGTAQFQLRQLAQQFKNLDQQGFLAPGAGANTRTQVVKAANALLGSFGLPPVGNTAAAENLQKLTNTLGIGLTRTLGQRESGQVLNLAINSNPGIENSPMAFRRLVTSMNMEAQRQKDMADFYKNYSAKTGGILRGAREMFDRLNPPQKYAALAVMQTVDPRDAADIRKNRNNPLAIQAFDRKYGKGVSSYFVR